MKKVIALMLAAIMVFTLVACGGSDKNQTTEATTTTTEAAGTETTAATSEKTGKTSLVVSSATDPDTINPLTLNGVPEMRVTMPWLETLFKYDSTGTSQPWLVDSYELFSDNMGITIKIKEGVLFHNGEEMTSEDVVFSIKYQEGTLVNTLVDYIDYANVTAVDKYTVKIPTTVASSQLLNGLTYGYVFNKNYVEAHEDDIYCMNIGTGPFMVDEYISGTSISYKRFDQYWGGVPTLETIKIRFISEASVAMSELETGGIDIVLDPNGTEVTKILNDPNSKWKVVQDNGCKVEYMGFNHANFSDPVLKEAICCAINLEDITDIAFEGVGYVAETVVPNSYFASKPCDYPEYNPERAKELLAQAGYADGLTLRLLVDNRSDRQAIAEQLQFMLKEVGVTLDIDTHDYAATEEALATDTEYDAYFKTVGGNTGEAYAILLKHTSGKNGGTGGTAYMHIQGLESGNKLDELLDQINKTFTQDEKKALYEEYQDVIAENLTLFPLHQYTTTYIMNPAIEGYTLTGAYINMNFIYFNE